MKRKGAALMEAVAALAVLLLAVQMLTFCVGFTVRAGKRRQALLLAMERSGQVVRGDGEFVTVRLELEDRELDADGYFYIEPASSEMPYPIWRVWLKEPDCTASGSDAGKGPAR